MDKFAGLRRSAVPAHLQQLEIGKRLDVSTARRFARSIAKLIASGWRTFVFDMTATTSVDSSGFGSLVAAVRKIEEAGGAVAIACADTTLRRLFEVAGITGLVAVVDDYETARSILTARRGAVA